jgi:hypothetical protein
MRLVELTDPAPLAPSFNARDSAVVERDVGLPADGPSADVARMSSATSEEESIEAQLERRGLLVISASYDPTWQAEVDGRTAPLVGVNYLQRGVMLEPG